MRENEEMCGVFEVDFDYEFDAARYFDLGRSETPEEVFEAELWFQGAGRYPPSPFAMMDFLKEKATTLPILTEDLHGIPESCNGIHTDHNHDSLEIEFTNEVNSPRCCNLSESTANLLIKQNKLHNIGSSKELPRRPPKFSLGPKGSAAHVEAACSWVHASKKQKLDGGHSQKVYAAQADVNLLHKQPQKKSEPVPCLFERSRLKLTIPQAPDLRTAKRANRTRSSGHAVEPEHGTMATYTFKARPLNRKILETPSLPLRRRTVPKLPEFQEFHLKTSERAARHAALSSSSSHGNSNIDEPSCQLGAMDTDAHSQICSDLGKMQNDIGTNCESVSISSAFKCQSDNDQILSCRGNLSVSFKSKIETKKQMGCNSAAHRMLEPQPPTELFDKLTLQQPPETQNSKSRKCSYSFRSSAKRPEESLAWMQTEHLQY